MRFTPFRRLQVALVLAAGLCGCHKQKPAPSMDGLTDDLNQTAEKAIAAPPSLANEQIILSAHSGQIDTEASQVLDAARAAGGAGIRSLNDQGEVSILATIPENNLDAFKAALRHEKSPMDSPAPSTLIIEILIKNADSPSPQPSAHEFQPLSPDSSPDTSPSPAR